MDGLIDLMTRLRVSVTILTEPVQNPAAPELNVAEASVVAPAVTPIRAATTTVTSERTRVVAPVRPKAKPKPRQWRRSFANRDATLVSTNVEDLRVEVSEKLRQSKTIQRASRHYLVNSNQADIELRRFSYDQLYRNARFLLSRTSDQGMRTVWSTPIGDPTPAQQVWFKDIFNLD